MPWLDEAIDRASAEEMLRRTLSLDELVTGSLSLISAQLVRHRLGRRAVVEYTINVSRGAHRRSICVVGKTRRKGLDRDTIRVLSGLRGAGFLSDSSDGISVPDVMGVVPEWHMWLSPKIEGPRATDCLAGPGGVHLAERIADVARKIHASAVVARRSHSISDELAVLDAALANASMALPILAPRIEEVWRACQALALSPGAGRSGSIHRDFYGDQIVVAGDRLFVLDFDQFSEGDTEVDVGNFMAHLTEQAIRLNGDSRSLDDVRNAMCARAVTLGASRELIIVYDLLTLARHIWISTRIADRNHVTEAILGECEGRLQVAGVEVQG